MTGFKVSLALSLAAHAIVLVLLLLTPAPAPTVEPPLAAPGIEVALAPSLPQPAKPPAPPPAPPPVEPAPPPPPVAAPPPPPPPPVVIKPPPPVSASVSEPPPPPPPPPKPPVPPLPERVPQRVERRIEPRQPYPAYAPPVRMAPPRAAFAPPAPVRAAVPSTAISPGYRALLSEWLEAHKRYPETARAQGQQGQAILRFVVERSGRVAQYAIVKSTGYPDLDAALDAMMRGATLPPFPPEMEDASITVSVAIRFSLGE